MSDQDNPYLSEVQRLRARLAAIERAAGIKPEPVTFTTAQIEDRHFWNSNRTAILLAAREGRIVESEPPEPSEAVVYPPTGFPGLRQTGPTTYQATDVAPKER
jgi:hypothetical protein